MSRTRVDAHQPVIGITAYVAPARWGVWELPATLVPLGYIDAVRSAGGRPVVLPPVEGGVAETLSALDGLVFCGGPDLDPALYGHPVSPRTTAVSPDRDAAELALLREALAQDLPVLGVCRGMQLINVAVGGTLDQHLPDTVGHDRHRTQPGHFDLHPVEIAPASRVAAILGSTAQVSSGHHQGLAAVADGLDAVAWAEDGSVEAIEDPSRRFLIGVLWHPEEGRDQRLFAAMLEAARSGQPPEITGEPRRREDGLRLGHGSGPPIRRQTVAVPSPGQPPEPIEGHDGSARVTRRRTP